MTYIYSYLTVCTVLYILLLALTKVHDKVVTVEAILVMFGLSYVPLLNLCGLVLLINGVSELYIKDFWSKIRYVEVF